MEQARRTTALGAADYLMNLYIDRPVKDWEKVLIEADIPGYKRTFAAISLTIFHLITSRDYLKADPIVTTVMNTLIEIGLRALK